MVPASRLMPSCKIRSCLLQYIHQWFQGTCSQQRHGIFRKFSQQRQRRNALESRFRRDRSRARSRPWCAMDGIWDGRGAGGAAIGAGAAAVAVEDGF